MKSTARSDVRIKVQEVRLQMSAQDRDDAPAVVRAVLANNILRFRRDRRIAALLFSLGLNQIIRGIIKERAPSGPAIEQKMLDLWPNGQRAIVKAIDEGAVFVPSRKSHVALDPRLWTPTMADEAGEYLITMGNDTIKRGELLKRLAELMRKAGPSANEATA